MLAQLPDVSPILQPTLQWGYGGLTVLLLAILVWVVRAFVTALTANGDKLAALTEKSTKAINHNSETIEDVGNASERQAVAFQALTVKLASRKCLAEEQN